MVFYLHVNPSAPKHGLKHNFLYNFLWEVFKHEDEVVIDKPIIDADENVVTPSLAGEASLGGKIGKFAKVSIK